MAKSTNLNFTQEIEIAGKQLTSASTTTLQTLDTAGSNDCVVKSLTATSDDLAATNLKVVINDGTTDLLLGTVRIAAAKWHRWRCCQRGHSRFKPVAVCATETTEQSSR
jgi:hypothetical protein